MLTIVLHVVVHILLTQRAVITIYSVDALYRHSFQ